MASNDPTDTGGLFIGRRPGTAPLRYRKPPMRAGAARRTLDRNLSAVLLAAETLLCLTLWGPQPAIWLWVGSQVDYATGSVTLGICTAFIGMLITLMGTLVIARQIDHAWRLVRRAAGYEQKRGALEWIFVISLAIAGTAFAIWFLILEGPGSTTFSPRAP
jgi:hypothetical protein